jgi:hypothetical protein
MTPMNKMNLLVQADGKAGLVDGSKEDFGLETIGLLQDVFCLTCLLIWTRPYGAESDPVKCIRMAGGF